MRIFILGTAETLWLTARHLHLSGCDEIVGVLTRKSSIATSRTESDYRAMAEEFSAAFMLRETLDAAAMDLIAQCHADVCVTLDWAPTPPRIANCFRLGVITPVFGDPRLQSGINLDLWSILLGRHELGLTIKHVSPLDNLVRVLPVGTTISLDQNITIADIVRFADSRTPSLIRDALRFLSENNPGVDLPPVDETGSYRYHPLDNRDCRIDWSRSASEVLACVQAFTRPASGAYTYMRENGGRVIKLHVWRARRVLNSQNEIGAPGQVIECNQDSGEAIVLTGDGAVALQSASEGDRGVWFEPGKAWRDTNIRLGLALEDEIYHLLSREFTMRGR